MKAKRLNRWPTVLLLSWSTTAAAGGWIKADAGGPYSLSAESTVAISASNTSYSNKCEYVYYNWDTDGNGSYDSNWNTTTSEVFSAAGIDGPATRTIKVKAYCYDSDGELDDTDTDTATVSISNVHPVITTLSKSTTLNEGSSGSYSVSYTDVESADTHSIQWVWGDGNTSAAASPTHIFANNGSYSASVTVTDDDGDAASESFTITVNNVAPTISSISGASTGDEGTAITWQANYSDPGTSDTHTVSWDFGDGAASAGKSSSHTYADEGTYVLTLTVCDNDNDCDSDTMSIVIANVAPTISSFSGSSSGKEGDNLSWSCAATDPGTNDTITLSWDLGDGTTAVGSSTSHIYADNGTYDVSCTATDNDGDNNTNTTTVVITNVAPTITGVPASQATEGQIYAFSPGFSDPGSADSHTWTFQIPTSATSNSNTGEIQWTPHWSQIGSHSLSLNLTDDDGGVGTHSWNVSVKMLDADGDGMSDGWESDFGLDPTDPADGSQDSDGDGRSNLDEWLTGTDPSVSEPLSAPELLYPEDDTESNDSIPLLEAGNATNPGGLELELDFELYGDAALTQLIESGTVSASSTGSGSWSPENPLTEDIWIEWRARLSDGVLTSDWTEAWRFFNNTENNAPEAPVLVSPFDQSVVSSGTPQLILEEATDPDSSSLTYSAEIWLEDGEILDSVSDLSGDGFEVEWAPRVNLAQDQSACWTAWATDDMGLSGPSASPACFQVDTENEPPSSPFIIAPSDNDSTQTDTQLVLVENGIDPENGVTRHHFEWDTSASFDSPDWKRAIVDTDMSGNTSFTLTELVEDTQVFLRVACSDGDTLSDWDAVAFWVNGENSAPSPPTPLSPANGGTLREEGIVSVENAIDPDGDPLTYTFVVLNSSEEVVATVEGLTEGDSGSTHFSFPLPEPGTYTWKALATDTAGEESDWSESFRFQVVLAVEPGDDSFEGTVDLDGTGGCGCSSTNSSPTTLPWASTLLALLVFRRREKQR